MSDLWASDTPPAQDEEQLRIFTVLEQSHRNNYSASHFEDFCQTCAENGMLLQKFVCTPVPDTIAQTAYSSSRDCTIEGPHPMHEWYYEYQSEWEPGNSKTRGSYLCKEGIR